MQQVTNHPTPESLIAELEIALDCVPFATTAEWDKGHKYAADIALKIVRQHESDTAAEWQPIETAPKHKILLLYALIDTETGNWKMGTGHYGDNGIWTWDGTYLDKWYHRKPTHWMSLPKAPKFIIEPTRTSGGSHD